MRKVRVLAQLRAIDLMNMKSNRDFGTSKALRSSSAGEKSETVFFLFCVWTVVNLCRPQDIFPVLAPVRPALTMGVITIVFALLSLKRKNVDVLKEKQTRYFFLLVLVMILGIPFSLHRRESFELVFFGYMLIVAYFVVFVLIVDSVDRLSKVLFFACVGSGIYTAFSVLTGTLQSSRLYFGSMFDPNDLSFFALCFIPLNLIFISRENTIIVRILCLISFSLGIALIFLSGSRGGALGLFICASAIFFRDTVSIGRRFKIFALTGCALMLSMASINTERLETLFNIKQDYNVTSETGRLTLWTVGVKSMLENPLTGVGVGRFPNAVGNYRQSLGLASQRWQSPHNSVVQIGAETGIFGLLLFLALSWNTVKIFARTSRAATSLRLKKIGEMGLAGFLGMFTAAFFLTQAYSIYWAFYIMLSAVVIRILSSELVLENKAART